MQFYLLFVINFQGYFGLVRMGYQQIIFHLIVVSLTFSIRQFGRMMWSARRGNTNNNRESISIMPIIRLYKLMNYAEINHSISLKLKHKI